MHTVLDGEATPAEARDLERLLATDASARTEFEELKGLFDALGRLPHAYPPEGLVAAVTASVAQQRQLFSRSRVIAADASETRDAIPESSTRLRPASGPFPYPRGENMSNKRKIWFGAAIAAAIGLIAISSGVIDFPKSGDNAAGTITPAQRYRGPQNSAADVKLGEPANPITQPTGRGQADAAAKDAGTGRRQGIREGLGQDSAKVSARTRRRTRPRTRRRSRRGLPRRTRHRTPRRSRHRTSAKDSAKVREGLGRGLREGRSQGVGEGLSARTPPRTRPGLRKVSAAGCREGLGQGVGSGRRQGLGQGVG